MKPQVNKDDLNKRMSTKAGLAVVNATSASPSNSHTAKDVCTQVNTTPGAVHGNLPR